MGRNLRLGKHTPRKGLFNIVNNNGEMLDGKLAADYINQYYTNVGEHYLQNSKILGLKASSSEH